MGKVFDSLSILEQFTRVFIVISNILNDVFQKKI